jgi:hypothetical protein
MIRFRTHAVLVLAAAAATPALAQTASTPTRLSGVTVMAPAPTLPKVVSTFPEEGKSVAPGALILKVTFDQKMDPDGWDYGKGTDAYPDCLARPRLEPDEKTFVLLCTVGAKSRFSIALNGSSQGAFENGAGQKATPATFNFTTDDQRSLATVADAMKAAGLKADEGPVMDVKPAAVSVTSAADR